jgi:hypothetical protein
MTRTKRWRELSGAQRAGILALGAVELALTTTAALDLARRPAAQVRGRRALWWPVLFVQPIGPLLYLARGRLTSQTAQTSQTSQTSIGD